MANDWLIVDSLKTENTVVMPCNLELKIILHQIEIPYHVSESNVIIDS